MAESEQSHRKARRTEEREVEELAPDRLRTQG